MKREQALQVRDLIPSPPPGSKTHEVNVKTHWIGEDCVAVKVWRLDESEPDEWTSIDV